MHTESMAVKNKRVAQGQNTRDALLRAARDIFGRKGYAGASLDDITSAAGVTKGALYHHFTDKDALFRAVFEQLQRELSDAAVTEFLQPDPWEALIGGCQQWIEAHNNPQVRQIVLIDARGVLGWDTTRAIENRFSTVALRGVLRKGMQTGILRRQPLRPLSLMLTATLSEACLYVAQADNPATAREQTIDILTSLLTGLRQAGPDAEILS